MYEAVGAPSGGEVNLPHRTDHKNYFYFQASSMKCVTDLLRKWWMFRSVLMFCFDIVTANKDPYIHYYVLE